MSGPAQHVQLVEFGLGRYIVAAVFEILPHSYFQDLFNAVYSNTD
jgi:hypothetical protein